MMDSSFNFGEPTSKPYVSCIKIDGIPILPPLMNEAKRQEMRMYKAQAVARELEKSAQIKNSTKIEESPHVQNAIDLITSANNLTIKNSNEIKHESVVKLPLLPDNLSNLNYFSSSFRLTPNICKKPRSKPYFEDESNLKEFEQKVKIQEDATSTQKSLSTSFDSHFKIIKNSSGAIYLSPGEIPKPSLNNQTVLIQKSNLISNLESNSETSSESNYEEESNGVSNVSSGGTFVVSSHLEKSAKRARKNSEDEAESLPQDEIDTKSTSKEKTPKYSIDEINNEAKNTPNEKQKPPKYSISPIINFSDSPVAFTSGNDEIFLTPSSHKSEKSDKNNVFSVPSQKNAKSSPVVELPDSKICSLFNLSSKIPSSADSSPAQNKCENQSKNVSADSDKENEDLIQSSEKRKKFVRKLSYTLSNPSEILLASCGMNQSGAQNDPDLIDLENEMDFNKEQHIERYLKDSENIEKNLNKDTEDQLLLLKNQQERQVALLAELYEQQINNLKKDYEEKKSQLLMNQNNSIFSPPKKSPHELNYTIKSPNYSKKSSTSPRVNYSDKTSRNSAIIDRKSLFGYEVDKICPNNSIMSLNRKSGESPGKRSEVSISSIVSSASKLQLSEKSSCSTLFTFGKNHETNFNFGQSCSKKEFRWNNSTSENSERESLANVGLYRLQSKMKLMSPSIYKVQLDSKSPLLKGVVFMDPLERPINSRKIPLRALDPSMKCKFDRVSAAAKGYLVRRLMRTEKIRTIMQTIRESAALLMNLFEEATIDSRGRMQIEEEDAGLNLRLVKQIRNAIGSFYDIFFNLSIKERMAIIATDRTKIREKEKKMMLNRKNMSKDKKNISGATLKSLERRNTAVFSELDPSQKPSHLNKSTHHQHTQPKLPQVPSHFVRPSSHFQLHSVPKNSLNCQSKNSSPPKNSLKNIKTSESISTRRGIGTPKRRRMSTNIEKSTTNNNSNDNSFISPNKRMSNNVSTSSKDKSVNSGGKGVDKFKRKSLSLSSLSKVKSSGYGYLATTKRKSPVGKIKKIDMTYVKK